MQERTFLFVSSLDINTKIHVRWISQQHRRFNHATKTKLTKYIPDDIKVQLQVKRLYQEKIFNILETLLK